MTLEEQRDVIQAAIDHKKIETRRRHIHECWQPLPLCYLSFDFQAREYRIAHEPREFWVVESSLTRTVFTDQHGAAQFIKCRPPGTSIIHVREVLE